MSDIIRKVSAKCAFIPCAVFVFASTASGGNAGAADVSFQTTVMNSSQVAILPKQAKLNVFGQYAIIDVAVSTSMESSPVFKTRYLNGSSHSPQVLMLKRRDGAFFARVQIPTNNIEKERVILCAETKERPVCSRIIIHNHS